MLKSIISVFVSLLLINLSDAADYWVSHADSGNSLTYKKTAAGDRIMDFSAVGYMAKDAPIPNVPVRVTVHPGQGIQEAINKVSALPVDPSTGFRGAIQLTNGTFDVRGNHYTITSSGVVIKGSSSEGTFLLAKRDPVHPLFAIGGLKTKIKEIGSRSIIVLNVASGSDNVVVNSTTGLKAGDLVQILWPQTAKWVQMMNMTGRWAPDYLTTVERTITKIDQHNKQVFLDIQIPFRIDLAYLNSKEPAYLVKIKIHGRINHVGLQDLRAVQDVVAPNGAGTFLNMGAVEDSWVKNVIAVDFGGDTMSVTGKRITVDNLQLKRTIPAPFRGAKPADFAIGYPGSQILVKNSIITGDNEFNYLTRNGANGPNVFFNSIGYGTAHAQPHSHFATGILYDNMKLPSGGSIDLIQRPSTHHGYTSAYSVVWNSHSTFLNVINPPSAVNWEIGCGKHSVTKFKTIEKPGIIEPRGIQSSRLSSLFLAQKAAAKH